ncbi:uncharacterized protein LOC114519857 [Dendronephthya gigantea]|uniref:uncharacterized protein LOC114519857 n=1 Tax=Dendronephthya gigantea TaxID=151771 RepID=UPI00106A491A|nr:uncharacterized protein LOC114519857 [Dendronephthya gigantea]
MAVSTNPLLFITECSRELTKKIAGESYSLDSYYAESFENEEITIVTEIVEEYLLYLEDESSPDVVKYNMKVLGKKFENLQEDAKSNDWDSQKTKNVFQEYEKELKRIHKLVKKGRTENPGNEEYSELQHDYLELEKKCHHTKRSCTVI